MLLACAAAALILATPLLAHVTLAPPFVEASVETSVAFEVPNERPGRATTSLTVVAPEGVTMSVDTWPHGWTATVSDGRTASWTGGRIDAQRTIAFPVTLTARTPAGTTTFRATQGYDDGEVVRWDAALSVLPPSGENAPPQHLRRALIAASVGLTLLAGSFLVVRRLRRRTLQER
jgi:uncharacterized protein YcnI